jgi:hypothetical protein
MFVSLECWHPEARAATAHQRRHLLVAWQLSAGVDLMNLDLGRKDFGHFYRVAYVS